MKVYTFLMDTGIPCDFEDFIETWSDSWQKAGWSPKVLLYSDAWVQRIIHQHVFCNLFFNHPTVKRTRNNINYELSCFLRWLVMSKLPISATETVAMTDYDVVNYNCTDEYVRPYLKEDRITLLNGISPSVVIGNKHHFGEMVDFFVACIYKVPASITHFSDQQCIIDYWRYDLKPRLVYEATEYGWVERARLVHYSNYWTPAPRSEFMKTDYAKRIQL